MDDVTQTDATNSEASTSTDATATTEASSSTTQATAADAAQGATEGDGAGAEAAGSEADPLDGGSILGEGAKDGEGEGKDGAEGDAGDKGGEGEGGDAEPALIGAPEGDYDLAGLLPEGTGVDVEALKAFTPTAKELNLSNEGLAKLALEAQPIVAKQVMDGMVSNVVAMRAGWDADTRAAINGGQNAEGQTIARDPVFHGKNFDDVTATAAKAIDRLVGDKLFPGAKEDGTPGTFRDFLKATGLGNHPAMVQFAYLAGAQLSEDSDFQRSGGIPNSPKSREEKYYGNSN